MARGAPLVGRDGLMAEAVSALGGRGVVLAGPAGIGRTQLLEACAERVAADVAAGTVVVVDDLHLVPAAAAGELRERVASGQVRILGSVLAGARYSEPVVRLWRDDGVVRLDVPPLDADAVAALAGRRVDGPVEAATVQRLLELSGGIPGDLVDLLDAVVDRSWFDRQHGVARLRPGLPSTGTLQRRLAAMADLSNAAGRCIELAALGRRLPMSVLADVVSPAGLAEARAAGFVVVDVDGSSSSHVARPATPLIGELVRMAIDEGTARSHRTTLARALATPVDADSRRLIAESYVDRGLTESSQIDLVRSVVADGLRDGRSDVVELAAALWRAAGDPDDGLALTLAYDHAGRPTDQADVAADVVEQARDDHSTAVAIDRLASALVRLGQEAQAVDELRRGLDRVTDPPAQARLTIALANRHLHGGDLTAAIAATEPLLDAGVPVPEAALVAAVAHAAAGQCSRALDLATMGEAMLAAGAPGAAEVGELVGPLLAVARALALTEAGRLDEAEAAVAATYSQATTIGDRPRQGWSALALGRIELARGRAWRALHYFGDSAVGFGDTGEIGYVAWALAGRAAALALIGDIERAREVVARREALPHERLGLFEPESQRLLAMVDRYGGDHDAARRRLEAAVSRAGDQLVARAACLFDLVRLGASEHETELTTLAARARDARVGLLADHATAVTSGDAMGLLAVATAYERAGAWLNASHAFGDVATQDQDARDRAYARRRAWAMASHCEGVAPAVLADIDPVRLTPRQLDVATLAAAGLSRPAIAVQLFLSDRTVDRHLAGAFAALGVRHQEQLAEALDDVRRVGLSAPPAVADVDRWPFVGRTAEANAIRRAVSDPAVRGVVLSGPVGCGKTRLATELQSELVDRGWIAVTIRGTAPHEAAMETLAQALVDESVALVVDDIGFLADDDVAAVRTALNALHGVALITTTDDGLPPNLDREDLARLPVPPLTPDAVRDVLAAALHGPMLGTTVAAFARSSAGNPLVLRELVRGARDTGRLVPRDGVWTLAGPLAPSPPLQELVRGHLSALDAPARRTLDLLAVTGSLPPPLAERLIAPDEIRVVIDSGLAQQDTTGFSLSHESYESEVLAQLSPERRAAILESVLAEVERDGHDLDPLRLAGWWLDAGRTPAASLLMDAAAQALWLSDAATAVALSEQAATVDVGCDGLLLAAVARSMHGQLEIADAQLARSGSATAELIRSDIARWLLDEVADGGDAGDARDRLAASARALTEGRADAAAGLAGEALSMLDRDWAVLPLSHAVVFRWVISLAAAGRLDDADAVLQARRPGMHRRGPLAHPGPEEGLLELARGRVTSATLLFRDALEDPVTQPGMARWAIIRTGLALAAALGGDADTARSELASAGPVAVEVIPRTVVEAWILAAEGDRPAAVALLAGVAAERVSSASGAAAVLAHDAVRLGGWSEARLLADLAGRIEGPLAGARLAYARAVLDRDPAAMMTAADGFAACGTDLLAADAGLLAASWWGEQGDWRRAKRAAAAANGWLSSCGGVAMPAVQAGAAALTPRQLDIARLAAAGLSSRDIATRLGLSVRTIDNQLQRVYERLAIRARRDLAAALATASSGTGS